MISGATSSCFPSVSQGLQMYPIAEDVVSSTIEASSGSENHSNSLLYSLSLLKDKVHQVQSLVSILIAPDQSQPESASIAIASMGTMIQEIIVTASSMMFTCQQMATVGASSAHNSADDHVHHQPHNKAQESTGLSPQPSYGGNNRVVVGQERGQSFFSSEAFDFYGDNYNSTTCNTNDHHHHNNNNNNNNSKGGMHVGSNNNSGVIRAEIRELSRVAGQSLGEGTTHGKSPNKYDIIELDAADLLAKYTHYCQVCGKGFKRDANLRMHMRAHGDEYKTSAALSNPTKNNPVAASMADNDSPGKLPRKYSCPQEGCRWNQKHAKFQPLKSMICVKNHYKRSHCPKMYVCKRCNRKQFSVLSDLRTHEKHCGDLKWQCSCGTTFSRKDKLMGHVALFVGHAPAISTSTTTKAAGRGDNIRAMQMQPDDRG